MGKTLAEKILSDQSNSDAWSWDIVIAEGKSITYDIKPGAPADHVVGTSQVADAVIEKLQQIK